MNMKQIDKAIRKMVAERQVEIERAKSPDVPEDRLSGLRLESADLDSVICRLDEIAESRRTVRALDELRDLVARM